MFHLAHGLQQDLGIPAAAVGLRHAHHGDQHLAVERQILAVLRHRQRGQLVDLLRQVGAADLEVPCKVIVRFERHSTSHLCS